MVLQPLNAKRNPKGDDDDSDFPSVLTQKSTFFTTVQVTSTKFVTSVPPLTISTSTGSTPTLSATSATMIPSFDPSTPTTMVPSLSPSTSTGTATSNSRLAAGSVAAIVIGCLFALLLAGVYLFFRPRIPSWRLFKPKHTRCLPTISSFEPKEYLGTPFSLDFDRSKSRRSLISLPSFVLHRSQPTTAVTPTFQAVDLVPPMPRPSTFSFPQKHQRPFNPPVLANTPTTSPAADSIYISSTIYTATASDFTYQDSEADIHGGHFQRLPSPTYQQPNRAEYLTPPKVGRQNTGISHTLIDDQLSTSSGRGGSAVILPSRQRSSARNSAPLVFATRKDPYLPPAPAPTQETPQ